MAEAPEFDVEFISTPDVTDRDGIKIPDYALITAKTFEALGLGVDRATEVWVEEGFNKDHIRIGGFDGHLLYTDVMDIGGALHASRVDGKWRIVVLKNMSGACICLLGTNGTEDYITDDGRCIGCGRVRRPKAEWEIMWKEHMEDSSYRVHRKMSTYYRKESERD